MFKIRILHTSDWHLGKYLNDFSLIDDQRYILDQIGEIAKSNKVDAIIIAGDIYHRSIPPAEAVELLDETLNKWINVYKIPVLAISGNHDSPERIAFGTKFYEGSGLYIQGKQGKKLRKVRLKDDFGYINFHLLPFIEPVKIRQIFDDENIKSYQDGYKAILDEKENKINVNERNIMVAHSFFTGVLESDVMMHSETERNVGNSDMVSSEIFKDYDYVALGHLHAPQLAGGENIRYSGSILKYSISEANQKKGINLVDINEKGNINIEKIPLLPKRDLRVLEGYLKDLLVEGEKDKCKNDYIFAKLQDKNVFDGMSRLRGVYPNIIGLSLGIDYSENIQEFKSELVEGRSISSLFFEFYEKTTGEKMTKEEEEIISLLAKNMEGEEK